MFSKKLWFLVAAITFAFAIWHVGRSIEVVYNERTLDDGTVFVSSVFCGTAPAMVFQGRFDEDVPGAATQADCLRSARTHLAETFGLVLLAAFLVYGGFRFGKEPPRPIRTELPDLPRGEPAVHGRRGREGDPVDSSQD